MVVLSNSNIKVGLLGGSFNPAHEGHLHISEDALERLGLDQIWWLVSPQNPLKPSKGMAAFKNRVVAAEKLTRKHPSIKVTSIEEDFCTIYTIDTLVRLKQKYRSIKFVWLMGADNLIEVHKWHKWQDIFKIVPIAVFDRDSCKYKALAGRAASFFAKYRIDEGRSNQLPYIDPPVWSYINIKLDLSSSTGIRRNKNG